MKAKYLETRVRRQSLIAAFDEERAVSCPVCMGAAGKTPSRSRTSLERKALLLVSDDAGLGVRLGHTAELAGLVFMQLNDTGNAFRLANRDCPAVVFLDLDLPALAGWDAAERFIQGEAYPSLVLLTGRTDHYGLKTAIQAGAVLDKTADPVRLLEKLGEILAELDADRADRKARQQLLIRWLRPYDWPVPGDPVNRGWGINE